jgi:hypothetical protein
MRESSGSKENWTFRKKVAKGSVMTPGAGVEKEKQSYLSLATRCFT